MDFFSAQFFSALLAIIVIDLVLAGDNAIVIGMAARNLPKEHQRKVIFWGTAGAIVVRALATLAVVWLLRIPGLLLAGGLLLIWIAYKLLTDEKDHENVSAGDNIAAAIRTIIIADTVMGLDNVLAVAGAAHGSFLLVVLGLIISVPIMVWGSTMIVKLIERYPVIIYIGSGVLALTAAKMIVKEPFIANYIGDNALIRWGFAVLVIIGVLALGRMKKQANAMKPAA
ncbi:TerC family protein [Ammoniphilus sp. CFH 90114]|uniref:TerC family protein n=1 Tax=Ammoniphilus sp. CFH 90114 TaxID=2493665 RepID=UPI00100ECE24|nr:TerC family protein [Ammoniphilus sp. CFH 90114]RXT09111.1 TerC family protein [Ammoniphilus sp. CFH 90114]